MKDAVTFLGEADVARNQYLTMFQGNVEKSAADHQQKVDGLERERRKDQERMARLERQLAGAQEEIRKVAVAAPLPQTLTNRSPGTPFLPPTAIGPKPPSNTIPELAVGGTGGDGKGLPRRPRRPAVSPSPSPPPNEDDEDDEDLYQRNLPTERPPPGAKEPTEGQLATMLTPEEIARLVGAKIMAARSPERPANEARIYISRLKMENPGKFDRKSTTAFNQWWGAVTMYLGFYPETIDRKKIAWVGTLLTETALVWHLHRYCGLRDNDTWANYLAAIWTEYRNEREAADAQLQLGQLKYQESIHAYLTEFRALNNFARATGEALREKVGLAMPDALLDMRFAHYLEDFADDEGFLQATHQAGLQVEKKKALK